MFSYCFNIRIEIYERERKDGLLLAHELDSCFGKERASISRLAEMRHFWHELINIALYSEAVTVPFSHTVKSANREEILGERKGDLEKSNGKACRMEWTLLFLTHFQLSHHSNPDIAVTHITQMTPK